MRTLTPGKTAQLRLALGARKTADLFSGGGEPWHPIQYTRFTGVLNAPW